MKSAKSALGALPAFAVNYFNLSTAAVKLTA
jgi:hypothetical protein